jgi:hypothetical protein
MSQAQCENICKGDKNCIAIETNGWLKEVQNGPCYLFFGTGSGAITNGYCVTNGDQKCFAKGNEQGDQYHEECWTAFGCKDDGATACSACMLHDGKEMYCCNKHTTYADSHACKNSVFANHVYHQCVTEGEAEAEDLLAEILEMMI